MKFPVLLVKYGEYFSKPANFLKIAGLAFLYLLIGLFAYSFAIYFYFIFPTQPDLLEFFFSSIYVGIVLWGLFFGYIPTFIGGIFLYFPIVSFYGTGKISRIGMALLGMFMGLISITIIAFLILLVFSNRGFPPTFIIHYSFGSLIASLVGVFAGINAYTDIQKQFQEGRIG